MKYPKAKYTQEQKRWCQTYETETTFEPLMDDYECGNESFVDAAKKSLLWFEDWSNDAHLNASRVHIPGDEE